MAYFPHAFRKVFLGNAFVTTGTTDTLTAGQFGFFDAKTFGAVNVAGATVSAHPAVVLATGSYHSVDKMGAHGGFKESQKSQIIRPREIERVWKEVGRDPANHVATVGWNTIDADTSPKFLCGRNYHLRIDLGGSPVLRLLGRTAYRVFDVHTGCCTNADSPEAVDPAYVLLQFAQQIKDDPVFSRFLSVSVFGENGEDIDPTLYVPFTDQADIAAVIVGLNLAGVYVDTKFGNCSFDPSDHFELEPIVITSAQLVDESGDPCSGFEQITFRTSQQPITSQGKGETVLRDLILSNSYRQDFYYTDPKLKEALNMDFVHSAVDRNALYTSYFILHTANRKSNPSGVYDNDQYLVQLTVPLLMNMATFESWINSYVGSVGTGVAIESY